MYDTVIQNANIVSSETTVLRDLADMVLIDPDREKVLCLKESSIEVDWFPYDARKVKGFPVPTMLRGKVIVEDGKFTGRRGEGEFIGQPIDPEVHQYPVAEHLPETSEQGRGGFCSMDKTEREKLFRSTVEGRVFQAYQVAVR